MRVHRKKWREKNPDYHKHHWLKRKYGISPEQFNQMLSEQDSKCAICFSILDAPYVDHNHSTGQIRGLLCPACNFAIGSFRESETTLLSAIEYLRKYNNIAQEK